MPFLRRIFPGFLGIINPNLPNHFFRRCECGGSLRISYNSLRNSIFPNSKVPNIPTPSQITHFRPRLARRDQQVRQTISVQVNTHRHSTHAQRRERVVRRQHVLRRCVDREVAAVVSCVEPERADWLRGGGVRRRWGCGSAWWYACCSSVGVCGVCGGVWRGGVGEAVPLHFHVVVAVDRDGFAHRSGCQGFVRDREVIKEAEVNMCVGLWELHFVWRGSENHDIQTAVVVKVTRNDRCDGFVLRNGVLGV